MSFAPTASAQSWQTTINVIPPPPPKLVLLLVDKASRHCLCTFFPQNSFSAVAMFSSVPPDSISGLRPCDVKLIDFRAFSVLKNFD
jgi:hypothetical protein